MPRKLERIRACARRVIRRACAAVVTRARGLARQTAAGALILPDGSARPERAMTTDLRHFANRRHVRVVMVARVKRYALDAIA